jgi:GGDEF domain-containing protein
MGQLTSVWTERHVPVALSLVVAVLTGAVAATELWPHNLVAVGAVLATVLIGLLVDAFGGLVVGLVAAAVTVADEQRAGDWSRRVFGTSVALVVGLVVLGWLVGITARGHLRSRGSHREAIHVAPAYGSLGLLTADVALARLDEEVARARHHHRPLTALVLLVHITDDSLDEDARSAARRAVARLLESQLRETDVPFDLGPDQLGAILPETGATAAWDVVGPVLDAASRAAFTVREDDERRRLVDCAELHAGLAVLGEELHDAESLIEAARRSAQADQVRADQLPQRSGNRSAHGTA